MFFFRCRLIKTKLYLFYKKWADYFMKVSVVKMVLLEHSWVLIWLNKHPLSSDFRSTLITSKNVNYQTIQVKMEKITR